MKKYIFLLKNIITSMVLSTLIGLSVPMILQVMFSNKPITLYYFNNKSWLWMKYIPKVEVSTGMPFIPWFIITLIIFTLLTCLSVFIKKLRNESK